jgi:short-subunit dehydrogenase
MEFLNNKISSDRNKKVVIIISISSDIGYALAKRYSELGYSLVGTYRSTRLLKKLNQIPNCHLFKCEILDKESITKFVKDFKKLNLLWDLFISCTGTQKPIGNFFENDFEEWSESIHINSIEPLRLLHNLYKYRNKDRINEIIFFAGGGGANKATKKYSAYTLSKIMLTKFCENLDFENEDLKVSIIGPGWVKTKMHYETINEDKEKVGENYKTTLNFMKNGTGTNMQDIFNCIGWICNQNKAVVGGRNFSVVYDKWKGKESEKLVKALKRNPDMYKLRRYKNEFLIGEINK